MGKGNRGRGTQPISYAELLAMIEDPATLRRKRYYLRHIRKHFLERGLTPRERERVLQAGWAKAKEFVHLLSRTTGRHHYERWVRFATRTDVTLEIVQQAAAPGWERPEVPPDHMQSITFRLPRPIRERLRAALRERGWIEVVGKPGGHLDRVDQPMLRLLRDAARGRRE